MLAGAIGGAAAGITSADMTGGNIWQGGLIGFVGGAVAVCVRSRTSHLVNLFEMNAKYATVIQLEEALNYIQE